MKKILIVGVSGAGKSTLAKQLSEILKLPFFPTDGFYWEANWKIVSPEKVRRQLLDTLLHDEWILDGNFDDQHDLVWKQADCIVWLDYSLPIILGQIIVRNIRWAITRQIVWSGNPMTLQRAISGIRHSIRSYAVKQIKYPNWLSELRGVKICRFHSRKETEAWISGLILSA